MGFMPEYRVQSSEGRKFVSESLSLESIGPVNSSELIWLDVLNPNDDFKTFLMNEISVDELVIEDVFGDASTTTQRFNNHRFITVQARDADNRLDTEFVTIIIQGNLMITSRTTTIPALDVFSNRVKEATSEELSLGIDFLLYELLDSIADDWTPILGSYSDELDRLEYQVFDPSEKYDNLLEGLHTLKRRLREAYKSIESLHTVLLRMMKPGEYLISKNTERYFLDTQQLVTTLVKRCNNYSNGATSTRDTYLSHVSLRLAESNAQLSEVVTTLTLLGAIILPLTLIAGIFGMNNEDLPDDAFGGFWGILGFMMLFAFSILAYFWRRGWLNVFKKN